MHVITVRNVHEALPVAIDYLHSHGVRRDSRNGPVYQSPVPVTTVYERPTERVLFWPERDANPFFHLYESLWMLAGRNDIAPLVKFVPRMATFSDDGKTQNGAYGFRWRNAFDPTDQLQTIAETLTRNRDDRRCVLQMWDAMTDLGSPSKDVPCNTMATFQVNTDGRLDLHVFCRSNDIIWGAYGANAVHFSVLLEYMALWIGVPVGRYYQLSMNWHGYLNTFEPMLPLAELHHQANPYMKPGKVRPMLLPGGVPIDQIDERINFVLTGVDKDFFSGPLPRKAHEYLPDEFFYTAYCLFWAHDAYKRLSPGVRFVESLAIIGELDQTLDWVVACREWVERRQAKAASK
jgi:thymidylate synthase